MSTEISVAIIDPLGGHCGLDAYDFGLCRGLLCAGCKVGLYTVDETNDPHLPGLVFHQTYRRLYGRESSWRRAVRFATGTVKAFWRAMRDRRRICHFHFFHGSLAEVILVAIAKVLLRRVVVTLHDIESFSQGGGGPYLEWALQTADFIVVHNETSLTAVRARFCRARLSVGVIQHGNYLETIKPLADLEGARSRLDLPASASVILFFGQIKDVKGLDVLIEAIPTVVAAIPEALFVIAGRPWKTGFARYAEMIDRLGVRQHCRLDIQFIPESEVGDYYGACDLVVLPYRKIYQSGVLLLTMSYEKVAVVSSLPGMTELIVDGETGFVFTEGSAASLSETLIRVLKSGVDADAVAARARQYVQAQHDWGDIGKQTRNIYEAVLR